MLLVKAERRLESQRKNKLPAIDCKQCFITFFPKSSLQTYCCSICSSRYEKLNRPNKYTCKCKDCEIEFKASYPSKKKCMECSKPKPQKDKIQSSNENWSTRTATKVKRKYSEAQIAYLGSFKKSLEKPEAMLNRYRTYRG
jgi:hypothetical protein